MSEIYFKLVWRNLRRYRVPYSISFSGLFLALAAFLFLSRYVFYHLSVDQFHRDADRIYRINTLIDLPQQHLKYAATAFDVGADMQELYPEITDLVRIRSMPGTITLNGNNLDEGLITYVDSAFFQVFSFDLLEGKPEHVLQNEASIILTKSVAEKYFGNQSPVGTLLEILVGGTEKVVTITGVVKDPPANSTINFSILAPMKLISNLFRPGYASIMPGLFTFVELQPDIQNQKLSSLFQNFVKSRVPADLQEVMSFHPSALKEIYFEDGYQFDAGIKGNRRTIFGLLTLAIITLLLAVINYINVSLGLGAKRIKEMAIRKVLGSSPRQIVKQQLVTTTLLVSVTTIFAFLLIQLTQSKADNWLDMDLSTTLLQGALLWSYLLIIVVVISLLSGLYPALLLTRLSMVEGLKKKVKFFNLKFDLKTTLVGFQFTISVFFLAVTWIIYDQLNFVQSADSGFTMENIILVDVASPNLQRQIPSIKEELSKLPGVESISASTSAIYGMHAQANFSLLRDSFNQSFLCDINYVDEGFLKTYQPHLTEGRDFSEENSTDIGQAVIVNEKAAFRMGLIPGENVVSAVVQRIGRDTSVAKIIGVVADYHSQSMHQEIAPMIWQISPEAPKNTLAIRMKGDTKKVLKSVEDNWNNFQTGETFDYVFLDEMMTNAYRSEQQLSTFVRAMTLLLLFITCTGMYGMMLFIIEQKTAEIGIRKTLGASIAQLQLHLHKRYLFIMALGFMVGGALSYWITIRWLENFAYRIDPQIYHFIGAGLICTLVATLTISILTRRAAQLNPVDVLKNE
ncbi:MAG: ABC transporter permease [Saprospiraceae bacterium]|nr:ABC transporter permease [Saprospiraceae bacterium]